MRSKRELFALLSEHDEALEAADEVEALEEEEEYLDEAGGLLAYLLRLAGEFAPALEWSGR